MQREILEKTSASNLRVFAIWAPFLAGTKEGANVSQRVLPDPRVLHYWDGAAATSDWFARNVDHSLAPAWDAYYLYGPAATWSDVPGPLISSGGTIIGQTSELKSSIVLLLRGSP